MTALSALHTVKTRIGLDDDCFRETCFLITGKRSTRAMTDDERKAVTARLVADYPSVAKPKKGLTGPYAKKLQALWISGWNLGLVKDRRDSALIAFIKRQTGIQSTSWLRDPKDANKALEALKKWLERAGVHWFSEKKAPPWMTMPGYRIAIAQCDILGAGRGSMFLADTALECTGKRSAEDMKSQDWVKVMNALGEQIRANQKLKKVG